MSGVLSKHKSGYQKRKGKEERLRSERKGLQTLFQVGVRANVCDNSSAAQQSLLSNQPLRSAGPAMTTTNHQLV